MAHNIHKSDYPLRFLVRVSTDELTALRAVNNLSKGAGKGNKPMQDTLKTLRGLEQRMEQALLMGPDA